MIDCENCKLGAEYESTKTFNLVLILLSVLVFSKF